MPDNPVRAKQGGSLDAACSWCEMHGVCDPANCPQRSLIAYGCFECLRPHDGVAGLSECPFCGGFTGPMPADEQPTPEARDAVLAWEKSDA